MAHLIVRDPQGDALALIQLDSSGTTSLVLSALNLTQARPTSVPGLYRSGNNLYVRVRLEENVPDSLPLRRCHS